MNGIEEGAQVNDIEVVKVNGTALNIDSKAVNITAVTGIKVNSDGDFKTGDVNLTGIVTSVKLPGENNTKTPDNAGQVDLSSLATNDSLTTLSGKVPLTREFAPTIQLFPMVVPIKIVACSPIKTLSPITTGRLPPINCPYTRLATLLL